MTESESRRKAHLAHTLDPRDTNVFGSIFGGVIMGIMDKAAAVAAWRYAGGRAVTASVHSISFRSPIQVGELVIAEAEVVYVGRSSMEVVVTVEAEEVFSGARRLAADGFFTMVAVDESLRPIAIPPYTPVTEEEREKWSQAETRRKSYIS